MTTGPPDFSRFGKLHVLLAEDNAVNQLLARFTLGNWGVTVDVADNGYAAIALHEKNVYDLILMDIQMPEMDGLETTQRIRRSPNLLKSRIPIIALTANARPGDRDLYLAAGMNDCLSKPYTAQQLYAVLTAAWVRLRFNPSRCPGR
ncbi:MAG: response regulator [Adhaeribacter sp.]